MSGPLLAIRSVKGSREEVGTFARVGLRTRARPASNTAVPCIGRAAEFAVLDEALARAETGHAQVVGVVGEAGVGKSRLSEGFAAACVARGVTVRRTAGLSHATDVALLPVLSLLRDAFGVGQEDGPAIARERISERVLALDPDLSEALHLRMIEDGPG